MIFRRPRQGNEDDEREDKVGAHTAAYLMNLMTDFKATSTTF